MKAIADRAQALEFSPIRKLTPYALEAKKKGVKVYHLNIGQPDIQSPKIFLDKIKSFNGKVVAYEQSDGNKAFKQSLVKYYWRAKIRLAAEDMVVTVGGSEALWMAFLILFNAGDECLTFEPTYANYLTFAKIAGVKLKGIITRIEDNFSIPEIKEIKKAVTKRTRGIIITNPSNPTGAVYQPDKLAKLVDFCLKKKLFIIADETYREFVYGKARFRSLMSFNRARELVVLCDSLSKRYSLCGARLGVLASKNIAVIEAVNKLAQGRLSAGAIEQYAASYLDQVPKSYFKQINKEYQRRRDVLIKGLLAIPGVRINKPGGAFYLIAQLPVKDAEDFCRFMLEKFCYKGQTVMLSPAEDFYTTPGLGKNQVRIAYVLKQKDLNAACRVLAKGLTAYSAASALVG